MVKLFLIFFLCIHSFSALGTVNNKSTVILDKLPNDLQQLNFKRVGSAKFTFLFWDIYNSTLYTKSGKYLHDNYSDSVLFEIEYLKDITSADLLDRTIEQWKHLNIAELEYNKFIPELKLIWPDISSGDKLSMLVNNNQSIFYFNDVIIGQIPEKEFSKLFLAIWLSPKTSEKELRYQLLGETK